MGGRTHLLAVLLNAGIFRNADARIAHVTPNGNDGIERNNIAFLEIGVHQSSGITANDVVGIAVGILKAHLSVRVAVLRGLHLRVATYLVVLSIDIPIH